jgi:gamma-butyrobetaine dioxygenase
MFLTLRSLPGSYLATPYTPGSFHFSLPPPISLPLWPCNKLLHSFAPPPLQFLADMLLRAGHFNGAWLCTPTLGLRRGACHTFPAVVPRPAVSAPPILPRTLCRPHPSSRYSSSQTENHVTPHAHSKRARHLQRPGRAERAERADRFPKVPSRASQPGMLVRAGVAQNNNQDKPQEDIVLEFERLGAPVSITKLWLRDACQCHLCVSESSGQKRFATCDVPSDLKVGSLKVLEDGSLEVSWANDMAPGRSSEHVSTYSLSLLHTAVSGRAPYPYVLPAREIWDAGYFDKESRLREISYAFWMEDGPLFAEAFRNLSLWGLVVIRGVPQTADAVERVASRLGHLQGTLYGSTWDVVSKPQAENVAYTNEFLCLHQDLMYLREPPRIQVLHCLENGCLGGDSLFSDGIRAAHELRIRHPHAYQALTEVPVDFHYAKGGHYWHKSHVAIIKPSGSLPTSSPYFVRWSPPFQAPFWTAVRVGNLESPFGVRAGHLVEDWQEAAKLFNKTAQDPANMVQFRLQPGDCVVFDNWRVLHGRRAFDTASGSRHLRGAYVEDEAIASTLMRLRKQGLLPAEVEDGSRERAKERAKAALLLGGQDDFNAVE